MKQSFLLTSNGGVHSSLVHLFKLCDIAKEYNIDNTFIHCFMDGRDTDPKSGKGFIEELSAHCEKSAGKIASIIGRYYAMDRDIRWERVKEAYDLLVKGEEECYVSILFCFCNMELIQSLSSKVFTQRIRNVFFIE